MTTVVALAREGIVYMASDSMTSMYDRPVPGGLTKILRLSAGTQEILVGCSGAGGIIGLLKSLPAETIPAAPVNEGADFDHWADSVAAVFTERGVAAGLTSDGSLEATMLLGYAGRLWSISHRVAVRHQDGIASIGTGEGPAIGALDAFLLAGWSELVAVQVAVEIGINRDCCSGGPLQVETLPRSPEDRARPAPVPSPGPAPTQVTVHIDGHSILSTSLAAARRRPNLYAGGTLA